MKKLIGIALLAGVFSAACNDEPKITKEETQAVDSLVNSDQKAQDSMEAVIKAMIELNSDTAFTDSVEED